MSLPKTMENARCVGSTLERSEEGKPRKTESKVPLMVVGSKSQRRQLSVSFQIDQRKLEI